MEIDHELQLYADGSYDPVTHRGGWSFVAFRGDAEIAQSFGGFDNADNGAMEVAAILHAVRWLAGRSPPEPAVIWSDSIYAVNGCNKWRHIWRNNRWKKRSPNGAGRSRTIANAEFWKETDQLLTSHPLIRVEWCKGHAGITGNERADSLADLGRLKKS